MYSQTVFFWHCSKIERPPLLFHLWGEILVVVVLLLFFRNNSCVCYSRKCENSIKKLIPTSKSSPSPGYSLQLDALSALTERQIRESSRASRKQPSPARGSGASVSVCVSARSNSRIPYLEARGSRCCQESQVLPKWLPAKYFKIKSLMGGEALQHSVEELLIKAALGKEQNMTFKLIMHHIHAETLLG